MRWTWFIERDGECWQETFATTTEAVAAMAKQQGFPAEHVTDRMAAIGIFLASAKVTVTPLMVLRPAGVKTPLKDKP